MISKKIIAYLNKSKVKYDLVKHKKVFTAFDLSQTLKEKMHKIAKTLLVKTDKKYVLVVLPAHYRLDMAKVKKFLKTKKAELAPEQVMKKVFKVVPGAMTPFGSLHKVEVILDNALIKAKDVLISAGSFTESMRLKAKDLQKLENASLADLGKMAEKKIKKVLKKKKK